MINIRYFYYYGIAIDTQVITDYIPVKKNSKIRVNVRLNNSYKQILCLVTDVKREESKELTIERIFLQKDNTFSFAQKHAKIKRRGKTV